MATVETLVNVCGQCGTEGAGVETHELTVDGKLVAGEACRRCWTRLESEIARFRERGRRRPRRR